MGWGPFDLTGKNAIVTGGAMGNGYGIAESLVEAGANVLIADLNEARAQTAAEDLVLRGPGKAAWIAIDIAAEDAGQEMVEECVGQFGSVDILVNNAGIAPMVPTLQLRPEVFDRVYQINLKGLVFASKAAGQRMVEQGYGGRIINIGSIDSFHPSMVGLSAYDSSKGGVLMFTKNFALEMAPHGILVNMIAPGTIDTPGTSKPPEGSGMTEEQMQALKEQSLQQVPIRRLGVPRDIGKVAVFLASSAADYMTGSAVVVDGGKLLT